MNIFGENAFTNMVVGITIGSLCLVGVALLGFGAHHELAKLMSEGLAALIVGAVFTFAPAGFLMVRNAHQEAQESEKSDHEKSEQGPLGISTNLAAVARTVLVGLAARRPMAVLGLAAVTGALILTKSEREKTGSR